jgi:hypothetical protein
MLTIWGCNVMTYRCDTTLLIKQVILMLQTHSENNVLLYQTRKKIKYLSTEMAAQILKHCNKMLIFLWIFKHYLRSKTERRMWQSHLFVCPSFSVCKLGSATRSLFLYFREEWYRNFLSIFFGEALKSVQKKTFFLYGMNKILFVFLHFSSYFNNAFCKKCTQNVLREHDVPE